MELSRLYVSAFMRGFAFGAGVIFADKYLRMNTDANPLDAVEDDPQWITVHPNGKGVNSKGEDIKGRHILIESESGEVLAGAGGKFTGHHISQMTNKGNELPEGQHMEFVRAKQKNPNLLQQNAAKTAQREAELQKTIQPKSKRTKQTKPLSPEAQKLQQKFTGNVCDNFKCPNDQALKTAIYKLPKKEQDLFWKERRALLELLEPEYIWWSPTKDVKLQDRVAQKAYNQLEKQVYAYRAMRKMEKLGLAKVSPEMVNKGEQALKQFNDFRVDYANKQAEDLNKTYNGLVKPFFRDGSPAKIEQLKQINLSFSGRMVRTLGSYNIQAYDLLESPNITPAMKLYLLASSSKAWMDKNVNIKAVSNELKDMMKTATSLVLLNEPNCDTIEHAKERFISREIQSHFGKSYMAPPSIAGQKQGKAMTFEEANHMRANPHFNSDFTLINAEGEKYKPYQINCQTCVIAHEMRLRGFDISAMPNFDDEMQYAPARKIAKNCAIWWRNPETNAAPEVYKVDSFNELDKRLEEGKRYNLSFSWNGKSGHIVSLFKENGKALIYDPQSGYKGDIPVSWAWRAYNFQYYRVDNCELFSDDISQVFAKGKTSDLRHNPFKPVG